MEILLVLAMGVPVVAFNEGGPAESLRECLPQGLVPFNDVDALATRVRAFLDERPVVTLPSAFTLATQSTRTIEIYRALLAERASAKN